MTKWYLKIFNSNKVKILHVKLNFVKKNNFWKKFLKKKNKIIIIIIKILNTYIY